MLPTMALLTCTICVNDLCKPWSAPEGSSNQQTDVDGINNDNLPSSSTGITTRRSPRTQSIAARGSKRKVSVFLPNATPTDISLSVCGHLFHTKCLQSFFSTNPRKCPKCRQALPATKVVKLFPTIDRAAGGSRISSPAIQSIHGPTAAKQPKTSIMERLEIFNPQPYQGDSYIELKEMHTSLMTDYDELQRNVNEQKDVLQLKDATLSSLKDLHNILTGDLEELKLLQDKEPENNCKTRRRRLGGSPTP